MRTFNFFVFEPGNKTPVRSWTEDYDSVDKARAAGAERAPNSGERVRSLSVGPDNKVLIVVSPFEKVTSIKPGSAKTAKATPSTASARSRSKPKVESSRTPKPRTRRKKRK